MGTFFNIGFAAAIPAGANPTPLPFALLTGFDVSVKPEYATFDGQFLAPEVVALKSAKPTGKIEGINIFAGALAQILGVTPTTGSTLPIINELHPNPGTTTITATNTTGHVDYAIMDLTAGVQLQRVAPGVPTTGQYTVAAGVYTIAAADQAHNFSITYTYTSASVGKSTAYVQAPGSIVTGVQLVGFAPSNNGKPLGVKVWNAYFDDYALSFSPNDFTKKNVSFFGAKDPTTGNILTQWTGE